MQELCHQLAGLEPVETKGLNLATKCSLQFTLLRSRGPIFIDDLFGGIVNQSHEIRDVGGELAQEGAQINGVGASWYRAGLIFHVVIRVVFPDDLDDNAHTNSERIATSEHLGDKTLDAGLRNQLSRQFVGANDSLVLGGSVGRDGDDGL